MTTRWRMPPENSMRIGVDALFPARGCRLRQQIDGALARGLFRQVQMRADGLDDLLADPVQRIEAGQRILEDHADAFSRMRRISSGGRLSIRDPDSRISPPEILPGRIDKPDRGKSGDGFAGAGFADHARAPRPWRCRTRRRRWRAACRGG
jgi:hypothetical protein